MSKTRVAAPSWSEPLEIVGETMEPVAVQTIHPVQTIHLEMKLAKRDYFKAFRRQFWRGLGWLVAVAPLLALLPIWRAPAFRQEVFSGDVRAIGAAAALYVALVLFMAFAVETCARMFGEHAVRKMPLALKEQVLSFSEKGLETGTSGSTPPIAWNAFEKAVTTGWAYQLHLGAARYILVPFDRLQSAEQRRELGGLLKRHLGDRAKFRV